MDLTARGWTQKMIRAWDLHIHGVCGLGCRGKWVWWQTAEGRMTVSCLKILGRFHVWQEGTQIIPTDPFATCCGFLSLI